MARKEKTIGGKEAKTAVLAISMALLVAGVVYTFIGIPTKYGLTDTSPVWTRFTYHFFHANIIHAFVNVWCLLSITFYYNISLWHILWAFFIASTYPFAGETPIIGMSGICFALMGELLPMVRRKWYFNNFICVMIALGFCFSSCAALLHLYCYAVSAAIGLLSWKR